MSAPHLGHVIPFLVTAGPIATRERPRRNVSAIQISASKNCSIRGRNDSKHEAARMTAALGGVLEEVFACPNFVAGSSRGARRERRRLAGSLRRSTGTR